MPENELITFNSGLSETLSTEDEAVIQEKLMQLLKRRTALYTGGDSSSVRVETAQELLKSIVFCLELYRKRSGESNKLLVQEDPEELFARAQKLCEVEIERGQMLYSRACLTAPEIENTSFSDTLTGIGGFFRQYDYRFFAHQIPCYVDYQLCHAVPDELQGVEFINEYLRRLIIEDDFVRKFEKRNVEHLLENASPDYRGLLINIFEPVCTNAIGLALLNGDIFSLCITTSDIERLSELFEPLSATPAKKVLRDAGECICTILGITGASSIEYVGKTAEDLYPRIEAALPHGNLGGIFVPF